MEYQGKSKFNLKQFMKICIFLIGFGILVWQTQVTFATFFSFGTTVSISKKPNENLPPPTIVLCQEHKWKNGLVPWHTNIIASYKFLGLFSISFKTRSANLEYLIELSHWNLMFVDPSIIESLLELCYFLKTLK